MGKFTEMTLYESVKRRYFSDFWSEKGYKGTVVNSNCYLSMEGQLKLCLQSLKIQIMLTVP